jgi:hypothetical protein
MFVADVPLPKTVGSFLLRFVFDRSVFDRFVFGRFVFDRFVFGRFVFDRFVFGRFVFDNLVIYKNKYFRQRYHKVPSTIERTSCIVILC